MSAFWKLNLNCVFLTFKWFSVCSRAFISFSLRLISVSNSSPSRWSSSLFWAAMMTRAAWLTSSPPSGLLMVLSYLLRSFSTTLRLLPSSMLFLCFSSSPALSWALLTSLCTPISCFRSSMLSWSCCLLFSRLKTSSALPFSASLSLFTSRRMMSCWTMLSSFSCTMPLSCCSQLLFSNSTSAILFSRSFCATCASSFFLMCMRYSLLSFLHCWASIFLFSTRAARTFSRSAILAISCLFSSSLRSPSPLATLRSICWIWNSAL
mmetsp:Transcript_26013/g.49077  ORF Transcript_26013/g.49077 Transcript_26013/m.49077 type:complete len:264 (-) Transcript_26013:1557-2348(-)